MLQIEFPKTLVVQGDIEVTARITDDEYLQIEKIFYEAGMKPIVNLKLKSTVGQASFILSNWERR
jgi:hypothetical protein